MEFTIGPNCRRNKVESSQITEIAHDFELKRLYVFFKNGSVYSYTSFSLEDYQNFLNAPSIGSYFYKNIKSNSSLTTTKVHNG